MLPTHSLLLQSMYKARKPWPPDFSKLTTKHKFALERRYRRRMQLKLARPRFHSNVRMAQWGLVGCVLVYTIFWVPWPGTNNVFTPIRRWASEVRQSIWTTKGPDSGFQHGQQADTKQVPRQQP